VGAGDRNDVEADVVATVLGVLDQPLCREAAEPSLLALVDGESRRPVPIGRSRLHLDHDEQSLVDRDEIDLTELAAPVALDHRVAVPAVPPGGFVLTPSAPRLAG
jgi:hypothetical protein